MSANAIVNVVVCVSCKNYRKKNTDYIEIFYHCAFDEPKVIRKCIEKCTGNTPRIREVLVKKKCKDFLKIKKV